jgi:hypothetical protein
MYCPHNSGKSQFKFFRATSHKKFNENKARVEGYNFSWLGQRSLSKFSYAFFPKPILQYICNDSS